MCLSGEIESLTNLDQIIGILHKKIGIRVPKLVDKYLRIDNKNWGDYSHQAIHKEIFFVWPFKGINQPSMNLESERTLWGTKTLIVIQSSTSRWMSSSQGNTELWPRAMLQAHQYPSYNPVS